jgi:hypothetical protein
MGGYRAHYLHKYDITNRLRKTPEFLITSHEYRLMRAVYCRYRSEFFSFQDSYYLTKRTHTGRPRLYWPIRYILARVCEEIGRSDLLQFIRKIKDQGKLKQYDKYWNKLKRFVDSTRLKLDLTNHSMKAQSLRPTRHR